MKISLLMLTLLLAVGVARAEDTPTQNEAPKTLEQREQQLQSQIERGLQNGNLTQAEADRLKAELDRIKKREAELRADGTLTGQERARLEHRLNELKHDIQHEKRDAKRNQRQGEGQEGEHQGRGEHKGGEHGGRGGDKGGKGKGG